MTVKIVHNVVDIKEIMNYWAKNYKFKGGNSLFRYEFFYDPAKGKVVFELAIKEADPEDEK